MSVKDCFRVILKTLGLILIIVGVVPTISSVVIYIKDDFSLGLVLIGAMLLILVLCYYLIFDSDILINKFKLTKGFDNDELSFNSLKESLLIEGACIVIGLYTIISNLPSVLLEGFIYFKTNAQNTGSSIIDLPIDASNYFYIQLIYFFLGIILIALRKQIINLIK